MFAETPENVAAWWKQRKPKSGKKRGEGAAVAGKGSREDSETQKSKQRK
jgi:hypothetical protein